MKKHFLTILLVFIGLSFITGWVGSKITYKPKNVTVYIKPFSCYMYDNKNNLTVERDNLTKMIFYCNKRNYRITEVITESILYKKDEFINPKPEIIE